MSENELNKIEIAGTVEEEPTLRYTTNKHVAVTSLRICNTHRKQRCWISATCWGSLAEEVCAEFHVGRMVVITGRLVTESWEDGGIKKSVIKIIADEVEALGSEGDDIPF